MTCAEIRKLLHAYADGELDLVRDLEVEQHLESCADCAGKVESIRSLHDTLRHSDLVYCAPSPLRKEIRKTILAKEAARESPADGNELRPVKLWVWKMIAAGASAFALAAILLRPGINRADPLLNEVVASHIRSLQANHLTDVASSDQHTVKPWFDGKLDFAPAVKDFADKGYPLLGGRLDYLGSRPVASLVYRHNKHLINIFIWPLNKAQPSKTDTIRGYSIIERDFNGMHYCFISDLNLSELNDLALLVAP